MDHDQDSKGHGQGMLDKKMDKMTMSYCGSPP
jgi:hypothetical protein